MAKLIKNIYDLVILATDKGITGYHSDSQIMDAIHEGQMVLWRQLVKKFPQDKRIRNDLLPFEKQAILTTGAVIFYAGATLPSDYEQEIEAWAIQNISGTAYERPISFKESGFFIKRLTDPVDPPTAEYPIARILAESGTKRIDVAPPPSPAQVYIRYWKKPVKPVFSTIESGGTYIYDDATSTDVEWSETLHDIIIRNSLARLGLNMRDGQVQRAGQEVEPKEATL